MMDGAEGSRRAKVERTREQGLSSVVRRVHPRCSHVKLTPSPPAWDAAPGDVTVPRRDAEAPLRSGEHSVSARGRQKVEIPTAAEAEKCRVGAGGEWAEAVEGWTR